jgi:hypothetical protein
MDYRVHFFAHTFLLVVKTVELAETKPGRKLETAK